METAAPRGNTGSSGGHTICVCVCVCVCLVLGNITLHRLMIRPVLSRVINVPRVMTHSCGLYVRTDMYVCTCMQVYVTPYKISM